MAKWVKGQSGNPAGRNIETDTLRKVRAAAQAEGIACIERLKYWRDQTECPKASVAACNALLDRGFGKPQQQVDISSSDGTLVERLSRAAARGIEERFRDEPDHRPRNH